MSNIDQFFSVVNNSSYNTKHTSLTTIDIDSSLYTISKHCNRAASKKVINLNVDSSYFEMLDINLMRSFADIILSRTAKFHLNNKKWSTQKQSSFVFNLLCGDKAPEIILYTTEKNGSSNNCYILDGLQRIKAVIKFLTDGMTFQLPSGGTITSKELLNCDAFTHRMCSLFDMKIYHFETDRQALDHYISINQE